MVNPADYTIPPLTVRTGDTPDEILDGWAKVQPGQTIPAHVPYVEVGAASMTVFWRGLSYPITVAATEADKYTIMPLPRTPIPLDVSWVWAQVIRKGAPFKRVIWKRLAIRTDSDGSSWITPRWSTVLSDNKLLVVEEADLIDPRPVDPEEER